MAKSANFGDVRRALEAFMGGLGKLARVTEPSAMLLLFYGARDSSEYQRVPPEHGSIWWTDAGAEVQQRAVGGVGQAGREAEEEQRAVAVAGSTRLDEDGVVPPGLLLHCVPALLGN